MSKEEAKAALAQLHKDLDTFPEVKARLDVVSRYNGELRSKITSLDTELASVGKSLQAARAQAAADAKELTALRTQVESLQQQLTGAQFKLTQLQPRDDVPLQQRLETLVQGVNQSSDNHLVRRKQLIRLVEKYIPSFKEAVRAESADIIMHQDAWACGYHADEYAILGMAIKFAGLFGRPLRIIGLNSATVPELQAIEAAEPDPVKAMKKRWWSFKG